MRNWKRLLSLLLAFSMVVSYCPAPAQATEEIAEEVIEEVVEEVVEEVPSEAPSETEAAESDEEVLTTEPEETESEEAAEEEDSAQPEEVVEEIVEEAAPEEAEETLTVIGVVSDSVMGASVEPAAVAAEGTCGDNLTWTLDDVGTLTISGTGSMREYGEYGTWPWSGKTIKSLIIEEGVTSISPFAFRRFSSITGELVIPSSVTSIGRNAFEYCSGLTSVKLEGPVSLGMYAFNICSNLETLDLGKTTAIGAYAFSLCGNLTGGLVIPESVKTIDREGFGNCSSLTTVEFKSETPPAIGASALMACSNLTDVLVPAGTMDAYTTALSGKVSGGVAVIKEKIDYVAEGTCGDNLTWTLDENGTLTISGEGAMADFASASEQPWYAYHSTITELVIDENITKLGNYAFYEFTALERIAFNAVSMEDLASINFAFYHAGWNSDSLELIIGSKVTRIPGYLFRVDQYSSTANRVNLTSLSFEEESVCKEVGSHAFYECMTLTDIELPQSLTAIGDDAFCSIAITELTVPGTVETLGYYAFGACKQLTELTLEEGILSIGNCAFEHCRKLENVTIPDSVTSIGYQAFRSCDALRVIHVAGDSLPENCHSDWNYGITYVVNPIESGETEDGFSYIGLVDGTAVITGYTGRELDVVIPGTIGDYNVTHIASKSFQNSVMTGLTIPSGITQIDHYAFYNCFNLEEIHYNASNLNYPGDYNYIFSDAGKSSMGIELTIGAQVEVIPGHIFNPEYYVNGNTGKYNSDHYPNITSITFEKDSACAEIGGRAFAFVKTLTKLKIPASITDINSTAFENCILLEEVIFQGCPSYISSSSFKGVSAKVYYPVNNTEWTDKKLQNYGGTLNWVPYSCPDVHAYDSDVDKECNICGAIRTLEDLPQGTIGETLTWAMSEEGVLTISGEGAMEDYSAASEQPWYSYRKQITDIVISDDVTKVGAYAFCDCIAATNLTIGTCVAEIGKFAFSGCKALTQAYYNAANAADLTASNSVFSYTGIEGSGFTVTVGSQVQRIPAYLFYPYNNTARYPKLTKLEFAEDSICTEIGQYAFAYNTSLKEIVIPDCVQKVETYAFNRCSSATRLVIGEGLTEIAKYAFSYCSALTEIDYYAINAMDLPEYNLVFAEAGVSGTGVTVTIGAQVQRIPSHLCNPWSSSFNMKLQQVIVEENSECTEIGQYAFAYNLNLKEITLPEKLTTIGKYLFYGCYGLEQIYYNAINVSDLSSNHYVLGGYTGTTGAGITVTIGAQVQRIPAYLFRAGGNPQKITCVEFAKDSVCTEIGQYAFKGNSSLKEIVLPDNLIAIGTYAFYDCGNLTEINLPDTLTTIGNNAFNSCYKLTVLCNEEQLASLSSNFTGATICTSPDTYGVDGDFSYWVENQEVVIAKYLGESTSITVPASIAGYPVTTLAENSFYHNDTFSEITLPDTLEIVGENAFYNCSNLGILELPASVKYLGKNFRRFSNITVLRFAGDAPVFDANALYSGALTVNYPGDNPSWTAGVMQNYGGTVTWMATNPDSVANGVCGADLTWMLNENGTLCISGTGAMTNYSDRAPWYGLRAQITALDLSEDITTIGDMAFYYCSSLTGELVIPENVTKIGEYGFAHCSGLSGKLVIPEGVTSIGEVAFSGCSSLTGELVLPEGLTRIEDYTFSNCRGLTGVPVIPENVTYIGRSAFYYCTGLSGRLALPAGLTRIGSEAFSGCSGLVGNLDLPASVTTIGSYAFSGCNGLTGELILPEGLTKIENYTFSNCSSLTGELVIPEKVTTIGGSAFYKASGLTSITFGENVKTLGQNGYTFPFNGCTGVVEMKFTGATPPANIYGNFTTLTALKTVYVPAASLAAYNTALSGKLPTGVVIKADGMAPVTNLSSQQVYSKSAVLTWDVHPVAEGYIVSRDGVELARTGECTYIDRTMEAGKSYTYAVSAYSGEAVTPAAELTVTTAAPKVMAISTDSSYHKINDAHNTLRVLVKDSGNLQPLGEDQTVLELFYIRNGEEISAGQGVLKGGIYLVDWDITGLADGEYEMVARLTDVDGVGGELHQNITIDRSHPAAISGLYANDNVVKIDLSWFIAKEIDTVRYNLYRRAADEDEFTLLAQVNGRNTLTYTDNDVAENGTYYYYITGVNELGAEGEASAIVGATLAPDITKPVVNSLNPVNGSSLTGNKVTIRVDAEDDVYVTNITLEYSADGSNWTELAVLESGVSSKTIDTTLLPDGTLFFRATARDKAGNTGSMTYRYTVDNTGPDQVTGLTGESTSVTVTLRWNDVQAKDIRYFRVERLEADGSYSLVNSVYDTLGINIYDLTPDTAYTYRVVGYDQRGNRGTESEPITVTTLADTIAPVVTRLRPISSYYSVNIPLQVAVTDDHNVASVTIQTATDLLNWKDVHTETYSGIAKTRNLSYTLDLAAYAEGQLYVRAVAKDSAGNISDSGINAPYVQHVVDKTAPAVPQNVAAEGMGGYVKITWTQGSETDLNTYSVYRAESADGEYKLLKGSPTTISWNDQTAQQGKTYYYKVCVNDKAGNTSAFSEIVSAEVLADTTKPVINSFYPADGTPVGPGNGNVRISAQDDSGISYVRFEYSADGENYQLLEEMDIDESQSGKAVELPFQNLTHGKEIHIRAWVRDKAGNESAYMKAKFPVDLTAPGGRDGKVAFDKEHNRIRISWIGNGEEDLYRYRIYRTYENKEILIGYCNPEDFQTDESGNKVFTFFDESLDAGPVSYVYRVEAVDQCGNTGSIYSEQMDLVDRSFPKAVITCENTMHTGVQYKISALDSKDNGKIVSYSWEFDDVYTSDQAEVIHAFAKSGKHSITLEVTDDANLSTKITVEVHVADPAETGTALIQILDESGNKVKGAPVYFDLGSSTQRVATTDSHGQVTFQTTSGKHMVGCVIPNNEYLPVKKEIEVAAGDQSFMAMTLVKQPLVTGAFETNRMTFEEIVAAGIDASRPENQHLMKADVRLAYGTSQVIQTSFIFDMNGIIVDDDIILLPDDGNGRAEPTRVLIPKVLNPGNTEAMTIAFLDMPLEATFLKEFFDVKLHILNNAASDFALVDNVVTLNIPDGLTLVESNESENKRTVTIDSIGGQSTHTVTWILRGDKPGEHHLSADYSGTLSQFNEKINATFQTENPIQVYGLSAMKLVAEISPSINYGAFYFNLSLVNNSDVDVYLPNVDVSGGVIDSYLLRIYEEAEDNTDVLLDPQKPQVRHLNTILENRSGKKQSFGTDTLLTSLAPGEKLTKRFAVYNVVGYNNQLLLREVLEESQAQWGIPFQIVISDMDLYNTDGSADKLAALAGDKQAMYNHILDGSNFFYVKSSVNRSEAALAGISIYNFAQARAEMDLDSADEAEVRAITRKIVAQLMVDEAMEEAIAGGLRDKSQHLVNDMMEDLLKYLEVKKNDQTAKDIHDFLKEYLGNGNGKKTLAEALTRASFDGMLDQLAQELKKAGMTDIHSEELDKYAVSTEFSEAQKLALRKLCQDHIAMLETLDATDSQWHSHADLLQEVLMITTTHEQIQEMLNMLLVQELHPVVISELEQIKNILTETKNKQNDQFQERSNNGNKGNGNNGNHGNGNNGNNGNKEQTKEDLEAVFGPAFEIPENQVLIVFGAMADQVAYWDEADNGELVMKLYNELSMAMTQILDDWKLGAKNEEEAIYILNVLKYLIQLRLLGEQSFAFFGNRIDNSDEQYENWLLRVNETLKTRYDSLDSYADYVLTMLLEFRDSIYVRASETLDVPAAPKVTIDYWNECTEEVFSEEYEYSFDGNTWKTGENDHIHLNPAAVIKHLWIRTKATEEQFAGNVTKLLIPARPRIAGDVTVVYDSSRNEYGLVGLTQGVYEYAVTKQQGKETFSKSITIENADAGCRIKGLAQNGTWMALRTEATDSSFCSAIRYVAIRIHVYRWEIVQKHGQNYLMKLDAGTKKQEVELENWNSGYGNACYLANSNNKSDGYVATGDKVSMNMPDGQMELTIIVTGDVDGNAWVDHDDVDKMIGHVGKYDEDHRLENEYYEAGCVHDGRQEEEDINIYDIYDVMDKVNGNGNKKEAAA